MPGECKEEVPPLSILPSYGGTAGLHPAVSVTVLESEKKTKITLPFQYVRIRIYINCIRSFPYF
jgi:hypothetical protein